MGKLTLILGGSNSGKSKFAEGLVGNHNGVVYLATAEALDEEMEKKIKKHCRSRPDSWLTIEEKVDIDKAIHNVVNDKRTRFTAVLLECILLWLNNIMMKYSHLSDDEVEKFALNKIAHTIKVIDSSKLNYYVISGEVGLGFIGEHKSTRLYGEILGVVNQLLAENASEVFFVVAGIPIKIK